MKGASVREKLAGRPARQLARTKRKAMAPVAAPHLKPPITRATTKVRVARPPITRTRGIKAPPIANRPIPLGRMGSKGPGLKTNLLRSLKGPGGHASAVKLGAKIKARKLGRTLAAKGSAAFHAPANLTSKIGAKIAGKRLMARVKG